VRLHHQQRRSASKQVGFTNTHFGPANRWVAKKSSNVKTLADLKGKTVVSTAGTEPTQADHRDQRRAEPRHEHHLRPTATPEAFQMVGDRPRRRLRDGRHPAGGPGRQLARPGRLRAVEGLPVARAVRDHAAQGRRPRSRRSPTTATADLFKTGKINALYDKWFMKPIPPRNITMNVPAERAG
jgi:glutamate/aspartate transport system substrate-binding protein